ncbi:MAG: hypothetical protein ACRDP3_04515, partial [Streptomyces sp.]|uniref:hypothetical protein n=1 Tax=Streptomyces sp. TaxID=1931 RepID=UPI003D6ABFB2
MANPGYGKRCVPDQLPRRHGDFSHLPRREASIAAYIDGLPDGAAVDIKTLAAHLPDYGQAACRTALNRIADAGHLRRFREQIDTADGGKRWVTRTFFSRGARDNAWWRAFQRSHGLMPLYAEVGEPDTRQPAAVEAESAPVVPSPRRPPRPQHPVRTPAYDALAALGRAESRLTLSARDCAALEALAAQWLARAPDRTHFTFALTAGLPPEITHPAALVRTRLENKMPPEPAETQQPKLIMLCTNCDRPGEPDALPGGLCA